MELLVIRDEPDAIIEPGKGFLAHPGSGSIGTDEESGPDGNPAARMSQLDRVLLAFCFIVLEEAVADEVSIAFRAEPVVQLPPRGIEA